MTLSRETLARAQAIIDNGFAAFVGDGLIVEIAGGQFIGPLGKDETETMPENSGDYWDNARWRKLCEIKPAQTLADDPHDSRFVGRLADRGRKAIRHAGAPGSAGRVAALRAWYALQGENSGQSAFDLTDEQIAEHAAQLLAWESTGRFIDADNPTNLGKNPTDPPQGD